MIEKLAYIISTCTNMIEKEIVGKIFLINLPPTSGAVGVQRELELIVVTHVQDSSIHYIKHNIKNQLNRSQITVEEFINSIIRQSAKLASDSEIDSYYENIYKKCKKELLDAVNQTKMDSESGSPL